MQETSNMFKFNQAPITPQICLNYFNDKALVFPSYQRRDVWNLGKQQCLISTILQGYPIAPIYLQAVGHKYEVVDGRQRLTAIYKFMTNKFTLKKNNSKLFEKFPWTYSNLKSCHKMSFNRYIITVYYLGPNMTAVDKLDLFKRVQNGEEHSNGELLNSLIVCNKLAALMPKIWEAGTEGTHIGTAKRKENIEIIGHCMYRMYFNEFAGSFKEMQTAICSNFNRPVTRQMENNLKLSIVAFLKCLEKFTRGITFNNKNKFTILLYFECWCIARIPIETLWKWTKLEQESNTDFNIYIGFKKLKNQARLVSQFQQRHIRLTL